MKKIISLTLSLLIAALMICPAFAAEAEKTDIPRIEITTTDGNGVSLKKSDGYIDAQVAMSDNNGFSLSDSIVMKVRGNSTAFDSIGKKSYTFKFSKKKDLFSMGSGKKWALISNILDPTLARNYTAFSIAQELGIQYTSNFKVVELWLDDSFRGCYLLMEPVAEGKDRVNIDIEGNDGKKDFLVELEKSRNEDDKTYITSNGIRFALSEPDEPEDEQVTYIQGVMDDTIATLKTGTDEEIEEKVDVDSFVKFYLLNEFLKPVDLDFSSVFFYYKDGKLYAGPPWDYDLSMGNENAEYTANSAAAYSPEGIFADKNLCKFLCKKDWFIEKVKALYAEKYLYFKNIGANGGFIDSFYSDYEPAITRNFAQGVWNVSRCYVNVQKVPLKTYEENYDYFVNWCNERVNWLTDYFEIDPNNYTEEPTTEVPTEEPTTEAFTTQASTTETLATQAPATEQPTTTQEPTENTSEPAVTEPAPTTDPYPTDPEPDIFLGELNDGYSLYYNNLPPPPWMNEFGYQYGKYIFTSFNSSDEEGHGVYVRKGYEKLMLSEAFNKGITDIDEVVSLIHKSDSTYLKNRIINTEDAEKLVKERYNREVYLDYIGIISAGYYLFYDNPMKPENKGGRALCEWEQEFNFGKYHFLEYAGHTGNVEPEDLGLYVLNDGKILNIEEALNRIPESVFANDLVELINSKDLLYSFKITYADSEYDETVPNTESTESTTSSYELPTDNHTTPATEATEPATNPPETKTPDTQTPVNPTQPKTNPQPVSVNTDPSEKPVVPSLKVSSVNLKAGKTAAITVLNKGNNKVTYKTTNKKVAIVKNGKAAALKKGTADIIVTVGNTRLIYKVKVTSSPKLSRKSVTVKEGKTKTVKIKGKSKFVKNKYKNSKFAKIVSKKSAKKIKIKGLKKGKTTLKITVNGVKLKLKVKVK